MSAAPLTNSPTTRRAFRALSAAALLFVAHAHAAPELLSQIQAGAGSTAKAGTLAQFDVRINAEALASKPAALSITLPGREPVRATRTAMSGESGATWVGRTADGHDVVLTSRSGMVRGRIYTSEGSYSIIPGSEGGHVLARVDPSALPNDQAVAPEIPYAMVPEATSQSKSSGQAMVDVLVVFSSQAGPLVGGQAEMDLFAQAAIDQTNNVLANSQVDSFRVRLARAALTTRAASGDPNTDLPQVRTDSEIAVLRASVGADVVLFVGDYTAGFNGAAYKNTRPLQYGAAFAGYAFGVVDRASIENSMVFVHELGHILGMDHDVGSPHDPPASNAFPYAYGHVAPRTAPYAQGVLTVMAYQGSCGGTLACQQVPYFSNSNIAPTQAPYEGRPIGVLDQAENYRVAAVTGPITAGFMVADTILASDFED